LPSTMSFVCPSNLLGGRNHVRGDLENADIIDVGLVRILVDTAPRSRAGMRAQISPGSPRVCGTKRVAMVWPSTCWSPLDIMSISRLMARPRHAGQDRHIPPVPSRMASWRSSHVCINKRCGRLRRIRSCDLSMDADAAYRDRAQFAEAVEIHRQSISFSGGPAPSHR